MQRSDHHETARVRDSRASPRKMNPAVFEIKMCCLARLSLSLSHASLSHAIAKHALFSSLPSFPSSPRHPLPRTTNHHIPPYHIPPYQIPPYRCQCKSLVTTAPETTGNHEKPPDRKTAKAGYCSKPPETAERHSHWIDLTCLQRPMPVPVRVPVLGPSHVARRTPPTGPTGSTPLFTSPPSVCVPTEHR